MCRAISLVLSHYLSSPARRFKVCPTPHIFFWHKCTGQWSVCQSTAKRSPANALAPPARQKSHARQRPAPVAYIQTWQETFSFAEKPVNHTGCAPLSLSLVFHWLEEVAQRLPVPHPGAHSPSPP